MTLLTGYQVVWKPPLPKICQERVGSTLNVERRSLTLGVAVKLALFPMIGLAKILTVKIKEY